MGRVYDIVIIPQSYRMDQGSVLFFCLPLKLETNCLMEFETSPLIVGVLDGFFFGFGRRVHRMLNM